MRKIISIVISIFFVVFFSSCLFYCMVAGAKSDSGTYGYVIMAALLAISISLVICIGFHYIQRLKKQLQEFQEKQEKNKRL